MSRAHRRVSRSDDGHPVYAIGGVELERIHQETKT